MMDAHAQSLPALSPERALQELQAGNRRYALGAGIHPNQTLNRRDELLSGQQPLAAVIGCSDSRVPPEILFDCGLGDLFVVRSAASVLDDATVGSLQYAAEKLGVKLIVVLGHSDCSAVKAAVEGVQASGSLGALLKGLQPVVAEAKAAGGDLLDSAIIKNIQRTVTGLRAEAWAANLTVMGAHYSLKSGLVTLNP